MVFGQAHIQKAYVLKLSSNLFHWFLNDCNSSIGFFINSIFPQFCCNDRVSVLVRRAVSSKFVFTYRL